MITRSQKIKDSVLVLIIEKNIIKIPTKKKPINLFSPLYYKQQIKLKRTKIEITITKEKLKIKIVQ